MERSCATMLAAGRPQPGDAAAACMPRARLAVRLSLPPRAPSASEDVAAERERLRTQGGRLGERRTLRRVSWVVRCHVATTATANASSVELPGPRFRPRKWRTELCRRSRATVGGDCDVRQHRLGGCCEGLDCAIGEPACCSAAFEARGTDSHSRVWRGWVKSGGHGGGQWRAPQRRLRSALEPERRGLSTAHIS
eukprot:365011-Chlamydomonas_euryale.AAC.31